MIRLVDYFYSYKINGIGRPVTVISPSDVAKNKGFVAWAPDGLTTTTKLNKVDREKIKSQCVDEPSELDAAWFILHHRSGNSHWGSKINVLTPQEFIDHPEVFYMAIREDNYGPTFDVGFTGSQSMDVAELDLDGFRKIFNDAGIPLDEVRGKIGSHLRNFGFADIVCREFETRS